MLLFAGFVLFQIFVFPIIALQQTIPIFILELAFAWWIKSFRSVDTYIYACKVDFYWHWICNKQQYMYQFRHTLNEFIKIII